MSKPKKKSAAPNIPPATLLRLRLDGLWQNPALPGQTPDQIAADLDAVTRQAKPERDLLTLLKAYLAAPPAAKLVLAEGLPGWLESRQWLPALEMLARLEQSSADAQDTAAAWLSDVGRPVIAPTAAESFFKAFFIENEGQAAVLTSWYTNSQRNRVRGLQFLIDHNPPWNGAVKDVMVLPVKTPKALLEEFVEVWELRDTPLSPFSDAEAKRKILVALHASRAANIRLPAELIQARELFLKQILALPDLLDTPAFSADDFDALSQVGQSAESVVQFEETVGRRIRTEDGKEVFIDAATANAAMEEDYEGWQELEENEE